MKRIELLKEQRDRSRELYLKTNDRSHLVDMFTLGEEIEKEKFRAIDNVGKALIVMNIIVFILFFFG